MTRKQKINSLINKAGENFEWSWGKYSYWETSEVIENTKNEHKFFFCSEEIVNHSLHYVSALKKYKDKYEMNSRDFMVTLYNFEKWLSEETNNNFKIENILKELMIEN